LFGHRFAVSKSTVIMTGIEVETKPKSRAGRPRSVESRRAILQAALLILQTTGYRTLTIEGVAAKAGVSKQTIYRWWPSAAYIVLEALTSDPLQPPMPDTGSLYDDLLELIRPMVRALGARRGPIMKALMAEAQSDARFAEVLRTTFMAQHRDYLFNIVGRAQMRGEIGFDADPEITADLVYGPMLYRLLNGHGQLDDTFARNLTAAAMRLLKGAPAVSRMHAAAAE
jgi:AcrR family transcriptional regulator